MALRNAKLERIVDWLGLQTTTNIKSLPLGWWSASMNVIVGNDGRAIVLRSPSHFNDGLVLLTEVLSVFNYEKQSGPLILFDIDAGAGAVSTYKTTGTTNTLIRSGQANARWKRLTINDWAYSLNGTEFVQTNGTVTYLVGIHPPAAAPTLGYTTGGTGSLAVGVNVSYAYRNSTTHHVSAPSAVSATTVASVAGSSTLRAGVVASTQPGVDGIVLFITEDGGSVRYLYVDDDGDPVIFPNTTGNIDISLDIADNLDSLTPETSYNTVPPQDARFQFRWRDRLCLCDFPGATTRQQVQYNVYENCYYGIPWESWFPTNIINIPNKADAARSGIETPLGALILGELDSYLIRGSLTDKIAGPQASISITEHMQSMNWAIGTRSPLTLVTTPFGEIWLDQIKRIQLWDRNGFPVEIGLPIRTTLDEIQDTDAARNMCEAKWFQNSDAGGFYVLTASTSGLTNNRLFIISVSRDPATGQMRHACAVSDIAARSIEMVRQAGEEPKLIIGVTDRLQQIFDFDMEGEGWMAGQSRHFSTVFGVDDEFTFYHSLRFDASSTLGLKVTCSRLDGSESFPLRLFPEGESVYALLDDYAYRRLLTFTFNYDDSELRQIDNLRVAFSRKPRLL